MKQEAAQIKSQNHSVKHKQEKECAQTNQAEDRLSLNESTISCVVNENEEAEHLENLNDMIHSMTLNNEHYKHIYMDILRNFECEQLNFNLNQTSDEISKAENDHDTISNLMCTMLEAICDDDYETHSIDMKLTEEANDHKISSPFSNGTRYLK
jgi:hypothetical protein